MQAPQRQSDGSRTLRFRRGQ